MTENNFKDNENELNGNSIDNANDISENHVSDDGKVNMDDNLDREIPKSEDGFSNYDSTQRQNSAYFSNQVPNQPEKKKKPIGLWVGLGILAIIVILVVAFAANGILGKSNAVKLMTAITKAYDFKQGDVYQEFAIDDLDIDTAEDKDGVVAKLVSSLKLNMRNKIDVEKNIMELDANVYLKDVKFLSLLLQMNNNDYIISVPQLTSKSIFYSVNELDEVMDQVNTDEIKKISESFTSEKIKKTLEIYKAAPSPKKMKTFKKLESKKHFRNMLKHFDGQIVKDKGSRLLSVDGKDIEFKGTLYQVKYDSEDFVFYYNSLKELVMDENFRPFIEEYLDNIINVTEKNQDLVLYNYIVLLTKSDSLEDIKLEWDEDIKGELIYMKELILDGIDKMQEAMNRPSFAQEEAKIIQALNNSGVEVVSTYIVDKRLKYIDQKLKVDGKKLKQSIGSSFGMENLKLFNSFIAHSSMGFLAFDKNVEFKEFNKDDAINYVKADPKEMQDLNDEIQNNVLKLIFSLGLF